MASTSMVPMIAPNGSVGDIPQEQVQNAVKAGFKIGVDLTSPDGQRGVVPMDTAHDAIKSGFQLTPPPMPGAPKVDVVPSSVGNITSMFEPRDPNSGTKFESVPAEQSAEGHQAAVNAREDQEGPVGQVAIGVAKGAQDTATG